MRVDKRADDLRMAVRSGVSYGQSAGAEINERIWICHTERILKSQITHPVHGRIPRHGLAAMRAAGGCR